MIFTPGIAVSQLSGSVGGTTASRNKGGQYFRNRAIPTNPNTTAQQTVRSNLATLSADWSGLTNAQRQAWLEWARQNPVINNLGNQILLSGQQAYIQLNSRIKLDGGTVQTTPPITTSPNGFDTVTQDGDIGLGDTDLTFTPALDSGNKIMLFACVVNSAGISYVENLYRFIAFSAADQASPWDNQSAIEAVLGTLVVGQTLHVKAMQYNPTTGQVSVAKTSKVVITTT